MELKLYLFGNKRLKSVVLIVPFMELKRDFKNRLASACCLNRTFYGIETILFQHFVGDGRVLIVPFMELKLLARNRRN